MEKIELPYFAEKAERNDWLIENKARLTAQKKSITKHADGIGFHSLTSMEGKVIKAAQLIDPTKVGSELKILAAINTTNLMDSHSDVHIPGLWKRSLQLNNMIMLVQEHKLSEFDKIIADETDVKPYTKTMTWKELGFNYPGTTQVLLFDAVVKKERNEYMFTQYAKGYVKNHSVGMRYVDIVFCMDDERYKTEKEMYDKYFPQIANADVAQEQGYFWAVREAKVIEGSAVPLGSNQATPVVNISSKNATDSEGSDDSTHEEQPVIKGLDFDYISKNLKTTLKNK